ncbi:aKG-HExxH-type peptide beta-hydroxylase [Cupriavidus basilensis]|uniref:aKG-HExxH-type peptide beta-hydroxylase n=1 Tax=Cupriavidus basilensis TaxID=68895 RepID=UPI0023E8BA0F|nr:HEXXH motif-containing putative peptide modification protein [Cupriavidus basilensis]MDF3882107.1 HEXXH motif-containing putative peptide modification protein [Cupriavidus basilensis]
MEPSQAIAERTHSGYVLFTAEPQPIKCVLMVRDKKNEATIKAYLGLVDSFEEATDQRIPQARQRVQEIRRGGRLNPSLHAVVHQAAEAMRKGDALGCYRALKWVESNALEVRHESIRAISPNGSPACVEAIKHMHNDETKDAFGRRAEIYETTQAEIEPYASAVQEVLNWVATVDPLMHEEMIAIVSEAIIFRAQALMGGSLVRTFGSVYIGSPDHDPLRKELGEQFNIGTVPYFMEHLVHETSHNVLYALMDLDPMVLNPVNERYTAPLRTDLRPIYGIYHACFVLSRMVRVFRLLDARGEPDYARLIKHFVPRLKYGLQMLKQHARMTDTGRNLYETFAVCAGL